MKILDYTVNMLGVGPLSYDFRADITVQICKLAESATRKTNQPNWSLITWHLWICWFCKTRIHHMASLELLILWTSILIKLHVQFY